MEIIYVAEKRMQHAMIRPCIRAIMRTKRNCMLPDVGTFKQHAMLSAAMRSTGATFDSV